MEGPRALLHFRPFNWTISGTIATKSFVYLGTIATITLVLVRCPGGAWFH